MSLKVLADACIGCGACDFSCPTGALVKTDSFLGLFEIDPFTCNDCGECVPKCPVFAIVPDTDWAVCEGRGCPLTSRRLQDVSCAYWQERCSACGTTLWEIDGARVCPHCDAGMKVACPRTHRLHARC